MNNQLSIRLFHKKSIRVLLATAVCAASAAMFLLLSNLAVERCGVRVHHSIETVPTRKTGLLLGTSRTVAGRPNLYFRYRIEAAAQLYRAGKIEKIIVSGDNGRHSYNEPRDMKQALIAAGVPAEAITADYAGFRTLDSVVRAHRIFGQKEFTVISQEFHCNRAIYIAQRHGLDAIGFAARDVSFRPEFYRNRFREILARAAAVLDTRLLGRQPKFGGEPIPLDSPEI